MTSNEDILSFIAKFNESRDVFLNGQCFYFAKILQYRFAPFRISNIVYNSKENHFACRIDGHIYDVTGEIQNGEWEYWTGFRLRDPVEAARIYRDCMWQIEPDVWETFSEGLRKRPWEYER